MITTYFTSSQPVDDWGRPINPEPLTNRAFKLRRHALAYIAGRILWGEIYRRCHQALDRTAAHQVYGAMPLPMQLDLDLSAMEAIRDLQEARKAFEQWRDEVLVMPAEPPPIEWGYLPALRDQARVVSWPLPGEERAQSNGYEFRFLKYPWTL